MNDKLIDLIENGYAYVKNGSTVYRYQLSEPFQKE